MTAVRCWLFGHDWLHLDTHFIDGDRLASQHLCDRCDDERTIVPTVDRLTEPSDDTTCVEEVDA